MEEFDLFIHVNTLYNLLGEIWKLAIAKLVSYIRKQRGSPSLSTFGICHINSCLLELRGVWYLATRVYWLNTTN